MKTTPEKAYYTGSIGHMRYWSESKKLPSGMIEMERLAWSEDCVNEPGVMFRTGEKIRFRPQANGFLWCKKYGSFNDASEVREVRQQPAPREG